MTDRSFTLAAPDGGPGRLTRSVIFAAWLVLALYFVATHVMWRDEVRAFTLALSGDTVIDMLRTVHGEGHPATWYLLLRAAHTLMPVREMLPAMGAIIGIAAAAMLAFRAPLRPLVIVLALFGEWMAFEYTAIARNYGMAALVLFVFADRYDPRAGRGWIAGLLLALLCNTNVPAILLAAGLLLFWLVQLLTTDGWRWTPALGRWAVAAACAAAGVLVCIATVYPPYQDAAVSPLLHDLDIGKLLVASVSFVTALFNLLPYFLWQWRPGADILLVILVVAMPLSLARTPGGLAAGTMALIAFVLFFQIIYPGGYRHAALLVAFTIALHWMAARGGGGRWPPRMQRLGRRIALPASALFALLLAVQVGFAGVQLVYVLQGGVYGRAAELGRLLHRPDLRRAIVMANPDVMVEALPYYADNPTWLVRQKTFGRVVHFTFFARKDLSLGEMLATACMLKRTTGRPIVVVLHTRPDPDKPSRVDDSGYKITWSTTPEQVRAFLAATTRIASFPQSQLDEDYDVYLLR